MSDTFVECCDFCGNELCSCLDPNMNPDSPNYGYVILSMEEWEHHFKPQVNHLVESASFDNGKGGIMFETYDEEYEYVSDICRNQPNRIWTYIDSDDGGAYIVNRWAFVNRIGYFITEKPYDDELNIIIELDNE